MEEKIGKALAGLVDAARPVEERYAELLALDENHFVRDSRLPAARVMDIWASDKVSESWKRNTLKRMMHSNSFYGVMFVPLELEFDCPLNRSVLELIRNQEFDELEGAAFAEKLAETERTVEGFWGALLRQLLYTEEYDEAYAKAIASVDEAEQIKYFKECETILTEQAANLYIQDMCDLVAIKATLGGYEFYPLYAMDLSTVYYYK